MDFVDDAKKLRIFYVSPQVLDSAIDHWQPLSPKLRHYICDVLRLPPQTRVMLKDVQGRSAQALIIQKSGNTGVVLIQSPQTDPRPPGREIAVLIPILPSKRMAFLLEKLAELGVDFIVPVVTKRTKVHLKARKVQTKLEHWRNILESAARQSRAHKPPQLQSVQNLEQALQNWIEKAFEPWLAHPRASHSIQDFLQSPSPSWALITGPEGGLDPQEQELLREMGTRELCLGPRILRAETAPIAWVSAIRLCSTNPCP